MSPLSRELFDEWSDFQTRKWFMELYHKLIKKGPQYAYMIIDSNGGKHSQNKIVYKMVDSEPQVFELD